jgi:two-component system LytT family sensor kinase
MYLEAMRARWGRWLGLWTLLGLVSSAQLYFADLRFSPSPYTFWGALRQNLPDWYLWGLLSLVVAWLARRFRIDRAEFGRHFFLHLGASLHLALLHLVLAVGVQDVFHALAGEPYPFAQKLVDNFTTFYHWNVLIYWAILAVVHARDYHRDLQDHRLHAAQLEARLAEARLKALALQLQPHFLFNTLNAVAELMHEDLTAAERMLGGLSELLRSTLDTAGTQEIPLERELQLVDRYLDIERTRFPDRLDVWLDIAPDTRPALVPAMILLPLVENAIRHGVAGRGRGKGEKTKGRVGVTARRTGGTLRLEVWDHGAGPVGAAPSGPGAGGGRGGIGLANTRARLEQLYGAAHRFELEPGAPAGFVVRLSFPYRDAATA